MSFGWNELNNQSDLSLEMIWPDGHSTTLQTSQGMEIGFEALIFELEALNCSEPLSYNSYEQMLCHRHNQTIGPWMIIFTIDDGGNQFEHNWPINFFTWNPPDVEEKEND